MGLAIGTNSIQRILRFANYRRVNDPIIDTNQLLQYFGLKFKKFTLQIIDFQEDFTNSILLNKNYFQI